MKRYKIRQATCMRPHPKLSFEGIHMVEDPNGEWIKFKDLKELIEEKQCNDINGDKNG